MSILLSLLYLKTLSRHFKYLRGPQDFFKGTKVFNIRIPARVINLRTISLQEVELLASFTFVASRGEEQKGRRSGLKLSPFSSSSSLQWVSPILCGMSLLGILSSLPASFCPPLVRFLVFPPSPFLFFSLTETSNFDLKHKQCAQICTCTTCVYVCVETRRISSDDNI